MSRQLLVRVRELKRNFGSLFCYELRWKGHCNFHASRVGMPQVERALSLSSPYRFHLQLLYRLYES